MKALARGRRFSTRHIGPSTDDVKVMLGALGYSNLKAFIDTIVPTDIRSTTDLDLPQAASEQHALQEIKSLANQNRRFRSLIGQGYFDCFLPPVIQRCILENPGWYTQYTPYQAEIAQGRLEALFNFQSAVSELCDLPITNASLLDEGTAAAEACAVAYSSQGFPKQKRLLIDQGCYLQTQSVVATRCLAMGISFDTVDVLQYKDFSDVFAVLYQNPNRSGAYLDLSSFAELCHSQGALLIAAVDPLSLCLGKSPGAMGADIAVGSFQRFGLPMGNGGPHAAFIAAKEDYLRRLPGRIVGLSKDRKGQPAYRLALQTREQHIRREKATSNICTSQVLLAVLSSMYCMYHGRDGLVDIANHVHQWTRRLAAALGNKYTLRHAEFFDTLSLELDPVQIEVIKHRSLERQINLHLESDQVSLSVDECFGEDEYSRLLEIFEVTDQNSAFGEVFDIGHSTIRRQNDCLRSKVFARNYSETEIMRYIKGLENKDLSLTKSMIPLGSCTMKLNAAAELFPITFESFSRIHPFAPKEQITGYKKLCDQLGTWLGEITGLPAVSLQPNSGAQGEFAGLLAIKGYLHENAAQNRDVCLIPKSAHGTNPASAHMCGFQVVGIECDRAGNIEIEDLKRKIEAHKDRLGAFMVTYPSTHGVFETTIKEMTSLVHQAGALVYMDGANMNAQVGLCRPGDFGVDVCHLNLHKTFCIPHGGGGPGVGPICATEALRPFLPTQDTVSLPRDGVGPVASAPYGSASILPIPWMYIRMMGPDGLRQASEIAILNANYIAHRLKDSYPILYTDEQGHVAHECIIDLRGIRSQYGIEVEDIAKRLIDYGFHAPTMSWPVPHTMMIEPTESESLAELDRFCQAMISIKDEIEESKNSRDNVLKNAPHTAVEVCGDEWLYSYSRRQAAYPLEWISKNKFWPAVHRVDNAYGDRNLVCTCESIFS